MLTDLGAALAEHLSSPSPTLTSCGNSGSNNFLAQFYWLDWGSGRGIGGISGHKTVLLSTWQASCRYAANRAIQCHHSVTLCMQSQCMGGRRDMRRAGLTLRMILAHIGGRQRLGGVGGLRCFFCVILARLRFRAVTALARSSSTVEAARGPCRAVELALRQMTEQLYCSLLGVRPCQTDYGSIGTHRNRALLHS